MLEQKRHEFGLDQPLLVQYSKYIVKICQLDFGISYSSNKPVWEEVMVRIPATMQLAISSMLLAICVSIPLGFLAGIKKNSVIDYFSQLLSFFGASIPSILARVFTHFLLFCQIEHLSSRRDRLTVTSRFTVHYIGIAFNFNLYEAFTSECA